MEHERERKWDLKISESQKDLIVAALEEIEGETSEEEELRVELIGMLLALNEEDLEVLNDFTA